jgi:uncharacterized protein YndB with AHSA1/START domain
MTPGTDLAVQRSVTVEVPIERAFTVFTEGFDQWWPRSHHLNAADMKLAVLERRTGGRWYEQCVDGSECDWGQVLAYEPPHRLLLSWQITPEWQPEPDPARASRIEVTFTAETPSVTRVDVVHSGFDRHGPNGSQLRDAVSQEGGWGSILATYVEVVTG